MKNIVRFAFLAILAFSSFPGPCQAQIIATEQKLLASDGEAYDHFGQSVAVSGDYAIVGATGDGDNDNSAGAAYIFHYNGTDWGQTQKLIASDGLNWDKFGRSVAISGDYAIVGASGADSTTVDAQGNDIEVDSSGSAYIFHYNGVSWVETQKLTASDEAGLDKFGESVSISGNYAIVGASGDDDNGISSGSAYIFFYDGTSWVQEQKLIAADAAANDKFGRSVSISGNSAIVGARDKGNASGAAYVFYYDGTSWVQQQKLIAGDGAGWDKFGQSVAISGSSAVVGVSGDDDKGDSSGSAYVFYYDGANWVLEAKLTANDGANLDKFGQSVAVSGDYIIVAAYGDGDGDPSDAAYIFSYDGTSWVEEQKLTVGNAPADDDYLGQSVAISDSSIIIGAYGDDDNGEASGSITALGLKPPPPVADFITTLNGSEVTLTADVIPPTGLSLVKAYIYWGDRRRDTSFDPVNDFAGGVLKHIYSRSGTYNIRVLFFDSEWNKTNFTPVHDGDLTVTIP